MLYAKIDVKSNHFLFLTSLESPLNKGGSEGVWKYRWLQKVFVSGCYDLLHSGHVEFFQQASRYGDLYVGIGSDATYLEYKHRKPMFPQEERLFMVKNIKAVKDAYINEGSGVSEDMAGEVA